MDRVQLAYLVNHFDIVTAVALDGGFSANGVTNIIDSPNLHILMNDPELRELGVSMIFTEELSSGRAKSPLKDIPKKSTGKKPIKSKEKRISPEREKEVIKEKVMFPQKEKRISPEKEKEVIKEKVTFPQKEKHLPQKIIMKNIPKEKKVVIDLVEDPSKDIFGYRKAMEESNRKQLDLFKRNMQNINPRDDTLIDVRVGDPKGNQTTKRIHKICMKGYDLKKWLSTGSYGAVYQACETEHNCNYVVKIQDLSFPGYPSIVDPDRKEEWEREWKTSEMLYKKYNIGSKFVGFGFCEDDNIGIIISELWSGSLAGKGEQSPCISKKLTDKLEKEIEIIGSLGLVHGDILPKNVLVRKDKDGHITDATLTDFGTVDTALAWQGKDMNGEPQIKVFYDYQNRDVNDKHYYNHNKITLSQVMSNPKLLDQSFIYYLRNCQRLQPSRFF